MICVCRSHLHGLGLFARKHVIKGECVMKFDKNCGGSVTALDDYFGRFINHSDDPSCKADGYVLKAQRNIRSGDEITLNYTTIRVPVCESWNRH